MILGVNLKHGVQWLLAGWLQAGWLAAGWMADWLAGRQKIIEVL